MKWYGRFIAALLVTSFIALLIQCKQAYPVEMPKLDRSGQYYTVKYEFSNETQELINYAIVGAGTFDQCVKFIESSGPAFQHNGTHTIYGCEKVSEKKNTSQ